MQRPIEHQRLLLGWGPRAYSACEDGISALPKTHAEQHKCAEPKEQSASAHKERSATLQRWIHREDLSVQIARRFPSGTAMLPCACQSPARGQGGRPDLYTAAVPGLVKHDEWNGYHTIIPMHSQPRVVLDRRIRSQQKDRWGEKIWSLYLDGSISHSLSTPS